ncbi:MAG: ATP-dependent protease, partial [Calditrichaeota bacterium]
MHPELSPEELKQRFDLKPWKFKSTREVRSFQGIIGQKRAVSALRFGLEMDSIGYNVFVAGPPGIGKMTAIQSFLEELASRRETPPDWCYVNNFDDPYQPQVLQLPPGQGRSLREDMRHLVEHIRREIPRAFESEEYQRRREELIQQFREQEQHILQQLNQEAAAAGFAIQPTPMGIMIVPVEDGHPLSEKEFQALPEERKAQIREKHQELEEKLKSSTKQVRRMEREFQNRLKEFDRQVTLFLVGGLIEDLTEKYADLPEVVAYLERVQKDIIENIDLFKESGTPPEHQRPPADGFWQRQLALRKYEVNVVVDNSDRKGAPVVLELNPGFTNLFGRIEKETQFGTLYTDFTLIKGGSLHRANGGYLVVPIEDVLKNPFSWDGLKRALRNGYIQIE